MPSPATPTLLNHLLRQGWPALAALCLALLLGWSALHEGAAGTHHVGAAAVQHSMPTAPHGEVPRHPAAACAEAEYEPGTQGAPAAPCSAAHPRFAAGAPANAAAPHRALGFRAALPRHPPGQAPPVCG